MFWCAPLASIVVPQWGEPLAACHLMAAFASSAKGERDPSRTFMKWLVRTPFDPSCSTYFNVPSSVTPYSSALSDAMVSRLSYIALAS